MTARRLLALCAPALAGLAAVTLHAAAPVFWQVGTQADLLKGETMDNVAIDREGRLVLGPTTAVLYEASAPFLWSILAAGDGFLVGTGASAKVIRLARDGSPTTWLEVPEQHVHALAALPDGSVLAASSPDGKVYRLTGPGASKVWFDPEEKYIWSLAPAPDGSVFVGTGEKAVIYRVAADGQASVFYRAKATAVTSLAVTPAGELLAGLQTPSQVVRLDRQGKPFVALDAPYREIRALRVDRDGTVFAVAVNGEAPVEATPPARATPEPATPSPVPTVSTEITVVAVGDVGTAQVPPAAPRQAGTPAKAAKGAIYRIAPDGLWDVAWESVDDTPFDLAIEDGGALLVATGPKGKLYRVSGSPARAALVGRAAAQQVTMLARDGAAGYVYAASNPGRVVRLSAGVAPRGVYESEVRDAASVASWGIIHWHAAAPSGTSVEICTRSGNTARPDETWSDWSRPYGRATGEAITSPKARYLQWRAVLTGTENTPTLTSVNVAYLPRNTRPVVDSITVHPPGVAFLKPYPITDGDLAGYDGGTPEGRPSARALPPPPGAAGAMPTGRRVYEKGVQTFVWKAQDEDGDTLQYDVLYRPEGSTAWTALRRGLWDSILTWDTSTVADGTYTVKVAASDAPASSPGTSLTGELESTSFDVDNTPPAIDVAEVKAAADRLIATVVVRDAHSAIRRVEYAAGGGRWQAVFPVDGIADGREERFELSLEAAAGGTPVVRAVDALNNAATAVIRRPPVR